MAEFNMEELEPPQRYQLMTRVVGPRPIAFVSSLSADGRGNLAPFSYFNIGGPNPPSAIICPVNDRNAQPKHTLTNIRETGEYVINVVTREMAEKANQASWTYPPDADEFDEVGFTRAASARVKPPRVAESPVCLEMELFKIIEHGDGPLASNYIIGRILRAHIDDAVLTEGQPDNAKLPLIGRLGGSYYCQVDESSLFTLERPKGPTR